MDLALRPMSTSQVLDRTFQLYRKNFVLFAGIAALPPALKLVMDLLGLLTGSSSKTGLAAVSGVGALVLAIAYLCGAILASAASTYAVSLVHLEKPATIAGCYGTIRPYFWRLVGIAFLIGLMMLGVGIIVAIPLALSFAAGSSGFSAGFGILGILMAFVAIFVVVHLYARFSLSTAVCVVEKLSAGESIGRSRSLTAGASGRIWLVLILMLVITYGLALVFMLPAGVITAVGKQGGAQFLGPVALFVGQFLASTIGAPILTISLVLIYYDQRVRKEAFDLQLMMEAVGVAQPGQAQAQAAGGSAPSIG
jgi:hypothetical protein